MDGSRTHPLQLWATVVDADAAASGSAVRRVTDADLSAGVYEVVGANIAATSISCPADPTKGLGIKLRTCLWREAGHWHGWLTG
jgi:hypothetical protein